MMTFSSYGDSALLVNFEQKIQAEINDLVIMLTSAIQAAKIPGILFCIPAYCSLTIGYDPLLWNYEQLCQKIEEVPLAHQEHNSLQKKRMLRIPVCYEDGFSLDFPEVIKQTGLSKSEIIKLHTTTDFRVFMLGFLPGFPYMGTLPEALFCSRKSTPRLSVPIQSVGLAGYQTGIYPTKAPGGWQIIGRTPLKIFDVNRKDPFMFQAGDLVRFHSISQTSFRRLEKDV